MKRFRKVYLEISNVCNLRCSFCPGTKRPPKVMTEDAFTHILKKLQPYTDYLYFHLMGEPLCHPKLERFLQLAGKDFRVILTTNGTLLQRLKDMLLSAGGLHKVNISLHSFEANEIGMSMQSYLDGCFSFAKAAEGKKIVTLRLWNQGGKDAKNDEILAHLSQYFPKPWVHEARGIRLGDKIYLEYGDKFDWPDLSCEECTENIFCYGLRDQLGVLCDGTVVPCCLDHEGDIPLGNLLEQELDDILKSQRAQAIYNGFSQRTAVESLCRRCGYARKL
ncbi:MAG: radical SAM protein [Oscillospiraceae bacterium]|nr:radical SAM protein [Oscillospiraceae bacterium]